MRRTVATALFALVLGMSGVGVAQDAAVVLQGSRAVAMGKEALRLYKQARWEDALHAFEDADALYHSPVFTLYAARCLWRLDSLLRARATFQALATEDLGSKPPVSWQAAQRDAQAELAAVEAELPTLIVTVIGARRPVSLVIDGRSALVGRAVTLDPGQHQVVIADGADRTARTVNLVHGLKRQRFALALHRPARSAGEPAEWLSPLLLVGGGVVLAAGGALSVTTLLQASAERTALSMHNCEAQLCPESRKDAIERDISATVRLGTLSGLLLAGGIVSMTLGLWLWLDDGQTTQAAVHLEPNGVLLRVPL